MFCRNLICSKLCSPKSYTLVNQASVDGQLVDTPYSETFFSGQSGQMFKPGGESFMESSFDEKTNSWNYITGKTKGLNPKCFAEKKYHIDSLKQIALEAANISVTVINFDETGRLKSYDLADPIPNTLLGYVGNYEDIQEYLHEMGRVAMQTGGNGVTVRDLSNTTKYPEKMTPFYKHFGVSEGDPNKGHVFFYVLVDKNLSFNRKIPLYTHSPGKTPLYGPFKVYDVMPEHETVVDKPDVLVVHFKRGGTMLQGMQPNAAGEYDCNYPYDIAVVAEGQNGHPQRTPLLIDPIVGPRGSNP